MASEILFWELGCGITGHDKAKSEKVGIRRFRSFFGISPKCCAVTWNKLEHLETSDPKHFLWCLLFLKQYNTEEVNRKIVGTDEKTLRKWVWIYVNMIAALKIVNCL